MNGLKKVPYEPIECEIVMLKLRDCFNSWLESVGRACISLYLKFQAYPNPIAGDRTHQASPLCANAPHLER
jgi:hypothetical protein